MKDIKFSLYPFFSSRKLALYFFIPRYVTLEKPHLLKATIFLFFFQQPQLMDKINAFNANPKFILIFFIVSGDNVFAQFPLNTNSLLNCLHYYILYIHFLFHLFVSFSLLLASASS